MSKEIELDQAAIDELLATANKELSAMDVNSSELMASTQALPITVPITLPITLPIMLSIKNNPLLFIKTLKQHLTKKIVLAILSLLVLCIGIGAFIGFKMANHNIAFASQTPREKLIQLGIPFEDKNLVIHAGRGNKEIVNAFLAAGMSANVTRATDGWSPLISASFYKRSDIVELLLTKQATVNLRDKYGKTALIQAAAMGAEDIVILLLEYGADPNIPDNNGRTPLVEAYAKQHARISEILKNAGATTTGSSNGLIRPPDPPPAGILPAGSSAQDYYLTIGKAGFVQIGMSLADLQKKYPELTVTEKYVDGSKKTITTIFLNNRNLPSLEVELSRGTLKLVSTISIYDEKFSTDKQITIKSTVGDIRNQYTINDIKVIDNNLFLVVKSMKMLFELDLSKGFIPTEWLNTGNPTAIPDNTKIKRIVIY